MRERHAIYLRRKAGLPAPWTDDPVMREYSITNPFRENDKTTAWLKKYIREPLRSMPEVLLAVALFRWFNRIGTGEAIFLQKGLFENKTPFGLFLETGDTAPLHQAIITYCGTGPYVTGSYIIQGWRGMNKLNGVLKCIEYFYRARYPSGIFRGCTLPARHPSEPTSLRVIGDTIGWQEMGEFLVNNPGIAGLKDVWEWLRQFPYLGDFMAHEIVQDLRYTDLLCDAPDINTWSNPGPGAERGLARVYGRDITGNITKRTPKAQLISEMKELFELGKSEEYWPRHTKSGWKMSGYSFSPDEHYLFASDAWPVLELHQIEMWLCEFFKVTKTRLGEGRPRGKFRHKSG
jgi:hypothetical protein